MKNKLVLVIMGLLMVTSGVLASGVTISYINNKTVEDVVTVGDTILYSDGLIVTLNDKSQYTLTYDEIEETESMRHEVTYVYDYTVIDGIRNIEVSSMTDDIVVVDMESSDTQIMITFKLNQENVYNSGDVLNIQFYFEAIEIVTININTATVEELEALGFDNREATDIEGCGILFTDLDQLHATVYVVDVHERFDELVNEGLIVFE